MVTLYAKVRRRINRGLGVARRGLPPGGFPAVRLAASDLNEGVFCHAVSVGAAR
jgi:hypothetical protein